MLPCFSAPNEFVSVGLVIILLVFIILSDPLFNNAAVFLTPSRYQQTGAILLLYTKNNYVVFF